MNQPLRVMPSLIRKAASGVGIDVDPDQEEGWRWVRLLCEAAVEHWEPEEWADNAWEWARTHGGDAAEYLPSTREAFVAATEVKLWYATVDPPIEDASDLAAVVYAHLDATGAAIVHALGELMAEAYDGKGPASV